MVNLVVKVKFNELQTAYTALQNSINTTDTELGAADKAAASVASTKSMQGATKDAIDDEFNNYTKPLIAGYQGVGQRILTEYSNLYHNLQAATSEYDSNAIIGTGALGSLINDVNKQKQAIDEVAKDVNSVFTGISDLIYLNHLIISAVDTNAQAAVKDIINLRQALWDFDGRKLTEDIGSLLNTQNLTLSTVGGTAQHTGPYTSTKDKKIFESDKYKKEIRANNDTVDQITQEYFQKNYPELAEYGGTLPASTLNQVDGMLTMCSFNVGVSKYRELYNQVKKAVSDNGLVKGASVLTGLARTYHNFYSQLYKKSAKGRKAVMALNEFSKKMGKVISTTKASNLVSKIQKLQKKTDKVIDHFSNIYKSSKLGEKASSFGKVVGYIRKPSKAVKNLIKKVGKPLAKFGFKSKIGAVVKGTKWLSKKAGWIGAVANIGVDTTFAYNDKSNAFTRGNVGQSVIHAGVNTIKNAGPLEGAVAGGASGSIPGAVIGFTVGTLNWGWGQVDKFFGINSKDKVYGAIEKGLGKGYDATVNAAQKTFGLFRKWAGAWYV